MAYSILHQSLGLFLFPLGLILTTTLGTPLPLNAQSCNTYMGQAVTGASVNVDRCSIQWASERSVNFTYYLGQMKINAQAHCWDNTWTTFHDGITHSPMSAATQNMLNFVCGDSGGNPGATATAFVFAPPSNVRTYANGPILCTVRSRQTINLYGNEGSWFYTDVCGSMGMIHNSQLQF
jgi:hypothetical protein